MNNNEPKVTSRRDFLKIAGSAGLDTLSGNNLLKIFATVATAGFTTACANTKDQGNIETPLTFKEGKIIFVEQIMNNKIPEGYLQSVYDKARKFENAVVVSKKYKMHWVFRNGELINRGPAGTAATSQGYETPNGEYEIDRKEGKDYTSKEYQGAKMAYASFLKGLNGRATHGSANLGYKMNKETGKRELAMVVDGSHGCINMLDEDAQIINSTMKLNSSTNKIIIMD